MQYVPVQVDDLSACACGDHTILKLINAEGRPRASVRIGAELGRSLLALDAGLVSGPAAAVVSLTDCMRAAGVEPSALVLWRSDDDVRVSLRVESAGAEMDLTVEPGVGFLTARHLRLDILLARSAPAEEESAAETTDDRPAIPDVYRPVLDGLRWDLE